MDFGQPDAGGFYVLVGKVAVVLNVTVIIRWHRGQVNNNGKVYMYRHEQLRDGAGSCPRPEPCRLLPVQKPNCCRAAPDAAPLIARYLGI